MLHGNVGHYLVHRVESLVARFPGLRLILVEPHTRMLLFNRGAHVPKERPRAVGRHVHMVRIHVHVVHVEVVLGRGEVVRPGGGHLIELVGPRVKHLAVYVTRVVLALVESGKQHVPRRRVRVGGVQPPCRRHKHPVGGRVRVVGRESHVPPSEQKVPGGVTAPVNRMRMVESVSVGLTPELVGLAVHPSCPVPHRVGRA